MNDLMGIVMTYSTKKISPISDIRTISALPYAGGYRLIDLPISFMTNAGVSNVGVVTSTNYSSLMDHLRSGKPWDLDRKKQGLNILPPSMSAIHSANSFNPQGDIDILESIYDYIRRSNQTYVVLSLGQTVGNINIDKMFEYHLSKQADITIAYKDIAGASEKDLSRYTLFDIDPEARITDLEVQPFYPKTTNAFAGYCIMERELLLSIIDECSARGDHDMFRDAFSKKLSALMVFGYEHKGYMERVDSLKSYFDVNMACLDPKIRREILSKDNPVYTKNKDNPPAKYAAHANVKNSLISDGCQIAGTVENSILARGVKVEEGATVRNSIIMQDTVIKANAYIDCVISDKEVLISEGTSLNGKPSFPVAIEKGATV